MAKGIDVYTAYQKVTSWSAVRAAGYEFCYVKTSDGTSTRATNGYGPGGRGAGILMGAYHYAQFGDPVAQANLLCDRAVSEGLTDLAPALDLESPFTPGTTASNFAIAFLKQVKARGHRPCLYANNSMLLSILPAVLAAVPDTIVWVARYGANPTVTWNVWQHSSTGTVPGISASSVDLNTGNIPFNISNENNTSTSLSNDEESTVLAPPAQDDYIVVPAAGRPPYLYIYAAMGRKVTVLSIDYQAATPGNDGAAFAGLGYHGGGWDFVSDRPGPIRIPDGCVGVVIRYKADHAFTAYVG